MATDRGAVLTIRAASRGIIDFRDADLLDVNWWRRSNALIRAMVIDDDLKSLGAALAVNCALVGNGSLDDNSFKQQQASAKETLNAIINVLQPWSAKTLSEAKEDQIQGLIDYYRKHVGDPRDPAFKEKLIADVAAAEARRKFVAKETDEDRIDRLLRQRTSDMRSLQDRRRRR